MELFELYKKCDESDVYSIFIISPRWENKITLLTKIGTKVGTEQLPYISIDYSSDEGVIGNAFDEYKFGNRLGRFINSEESILYSDFDIIPFDEGAKIAKMFSDEFNSKWYR